MELHEAVSTLTIRYPMWLGPVLLVVGYALSIWLFKGAHRTKSPIPQRVAGVAGVVIVSLVGYGAMVDGTTLDAAGAREIRLLAVQHAAWNEVAEVRVEERTVGKRGKQPHLVLRKVPYGEMAVELSGLEPAEIERVVAFARARMGK